MLFHMLLNTPIIIERAREMMPAREVFTVVDWFLVGYIIAQHDRLWWADDIIIVCTYNGHQWLE